MSDLDALVHATSPHKDEIEALWRSSCAEAASTVVVLDDDPTGTQTVHDVPVYANWDFSTLDDAFRAGDKMFFVLTNSRSFSEEKTTQVHREIAENLARVKKGQGKDFVLVSRGDSTLRGHYPLEDEVLRATLEAESDCVFDAEVICPAFFEGGRFTYGDVHYMLRDGEYIPVGETEFAKDATFGYRSSNLVDYVCEKSNGAVRESDCVTISVDELRSFDLDSIVNKLLSCSRFKKVIVNALNYDDLKTFAICFLRARAQGKSFICRTAASFAKCLSGCEDIELLGADAIEDKGNPNGGLVIVGSHVKLSTQQLEALRGSSLPLDFCEFNAAGADEDGTFTSESARVTERVEKTIGSGKTVVVYSTRKDQTNDAMDAESKLALSVNISDGLTSVVSNLGVRPRYLIAKGGITSSDVATKGLKVVKAEVMGQAAKGIPVWKCGDESRFPGLAYLIFPGNVGNPDTLKSIVEELER